MTLHIWILHMYHDILFPHRYILDVFHVCTGKFIMFWWRELCRWIFHVHCGLCKLSDTMLLWQGVEWVYMYHDLCFNLDLFGYMIAMHIHCYVHQDVKVNGTIWLICKCTLCYDLAIGFSWFTKSVALPGLQITILCIICFVLLNTEGLHMIRLSIYFLHIEWVYW